MNLAWRSCSCAELCCFRQDSSLSTCMIRQLVAFEDTCGYRHSQPIQYSPPSPLSTRSLAAWRGQFPARNLEISKARRGRGGWIQVHLILRYMPQNLARCRACCLYDAFMKPRYDERVSPASDTSGAVSLCTCMGSPASSSTRFESSPP